MQELRAATKDILERVEKLSGRPIQFLRDVNIPVLATIHMARHGAPYHVLRYKPSNDPLDYFVAYQAGFVLRLFETPAEARYDFVPNESGKATLEALITAGQPLGRSEMEQLPALLSLTHHWALLNLRSLPIGMRIDQWLMDQYQDLVDLVAPGVALQQQLNANIFSTRLGKFGVPTHLLAPNAAYALLADRLFNTAFSTPYSAAGVLEQGRTLFQIWEEIPNAPTHDRELVDCWAKALGMTGWYDWAPYTP
jgi:hypothetical protein